MTKKFVLIGAGSLSFGPGTLGDIFSSPVLSGSHIVLHDINPQSLARVEQLAQDYIREHDLPFSVSATTSRPEALQGADFCVISIEVGNRFTLWEQDWMVPLQYGFRQVYGENGGPGGLFHSLRIIPPILEICDDIHAICPEALVINFSNPMSRICLAIKRRHPDLKVVGFCHEVVSLVEHLPKILETPLSNLNFRAAGLNHFSVLLEVKYKDSGEDAYPLVRARAPAYFENLPSLTPLRREGFTGSLGEARPAKWADRGVFKEILERFGYLPITEDSHFGEYVHWAHTVADHQGILDFYDWYKKWSLQKVEAKITPRQREEHWRIVPILEGILTDSGHEEMALNIPNAGLIDNLPQDLVVEVPARIDKDGVHGIRLGELPKGIAGLLNIQAAIQDLNVEAVLTRSKAVALQALLVDPLVDDPGKAEHLLETMLKLQQPYLEYLK